VLKASLAEIDGEECNLGAPCVDGLCEVFREGWHSKEIGPKGDSIVCLL